MSKCGKTISSLTEVMSKKLGDLHQSMAETAIKLQTMAREAEVTELKKLSSYSQTIGEQLAQIQTALSNIQDNNKTETEALRIAHSTLDEMQTTLKNEFVSWGASLTSTYSTICDDLQQSSQRGMAAVERAFGDVHSVLEAVLRDVQEYIKGELGSLERSRQLTNNAAQAEIAHLRQQNEMLIQILKSEKMKADKAKETLMHRMSEMLDAFMNEQHSRLEERMNGLHDQNVKAEGALESYLQQQGSLFDQMVCNGNSANTTLQKQSASAKRTRDGAFKVNICPVFRSWYIHHLPLDSRSYEVDDQGEVTGIA